MDLIHILDKLCYDNELKNVCNIKIKYSLACWDASRTQLSLLEIQFQFFILPLQAFTCARTQVVASAPP